MAMIRAAVWTVILLACLVIWSAFIWVLIEVAT